MRTGLDAKFCKMCRRQLLRSVWPFIMHDINATPYKVCENKQKSIFPLTLEYIFEICNKNRMTKEYTNFPFVVYCIH